MEPTGRRNRVWLSWSKYQCCFVGVGKPFSPERCRMLLALRINVLAKGYSGISLETLRQVIEIFNGKAVNPWTKLLWRLGAFCRLDLTDSTPKGSGDKKEWKMGPTRQRTAGWTEGTKGAKTVL